MKLSGVVERMRRQKHSTMETVRKQVRKEAACGTDERKTSVFMKIGRK